MKVFEIPKYAELVLENLRLKAKIKSLDQLTLELHESGCELYEDLERVRDEARALRANYEGWRYECKKAWLDNEQWLEKYGHLVSDNDS